ncbi:hypothetical protein [Sinorhizobium meliloti]|uniref:hypothetical protein n=1 Tax=Rhizobium meliloti TaxID=382 RepID=UPI001F406317|nr:hypothetical protein [Sinorhizobium meliloti]
MQSTYGAMEGDGIGDLTVLYESERLAEASGVPAAINRAAYFYTNLDMLLEPARQGSPRAAGTSARFRHKRALQSPCCRSRSELPDRLRLRSSRGSRPKSPARRWHGKLLPRRLGGGYRKQRNDEGGNSDFE